MLRTFSAFALMLGCLAAPLAGADVNLTGTHWERVARQHGLDARVLYAVALQESRKACGSSLTSPWPWTIRSPEGSRFFESRGEAASELNRLVGAYRPWTIDVGIMQVNLGWHGHKVADPALLLDPKVNLEVAATILQEALASAPGDPELAVGRYNTYTEAKARSYGRQVLRVLAALGGHL